MKYLAITAAFLLSSAAFAQSTPPAEPASPSMTAPEMPPAGETPAAPSAGPAMPANPSTSTMPEGQTAPTMPTASDATANPTMPEQSTMQTPAAPAPTAQAIYPRCSRTVVDQCIQGSARERDTKRRSRRS